MAKSYFLYQKYQKIGQTGNWIPVYPLEYSYNADGTMMPVTKNNNDPACGAAQPIYRWVETEQYECVYEADPTPTGYTDQYLTIESLGDSNTIKFASFEMGAMTISASTDNGQTWSAFTANDSEATIATVNNGDKILFKGLNERYYSENGLTMNDGSYFTTSNRFNLYGNIMSLVSGDTFTSTTSVSSYAFKYFFYATKVVDASNLILPATTLGLGCYSFMFNSCGQLVEAPALPATTLANSCYAYMFEYCTSLNYVKCLATDISASYCTTNWVSGVAANGTFVKNPNMSSWTTGTSGIPSNWTVQDA